MRSWSMVNCPRVCMCVYGCLCVWCGPLCRYQFSCICSQGLSDSVGVWRGGCSDQHGSAVRSSPPAIGAFSAVRWRSAASSKENRIQQRLSNKNNHSTVWQNGDWIMKNVVNYPQRSWCRLHPFPNNDYCLRKRTGISIFEHNSAGLWCTSLTRVWNEFKLN